MSLKSLLGVLPVYAIFLLPILTAAFLFIMHRRNAGRLGGRSQTQTFVPSDDQGNPLGPAEVGFLIDNQLDGRDVAAAVFSLAMKGHLRIQVQREVVTAADYVRQNEKYLLTRTGKEDSGLTEFEKHLLGYLSEGAGEGAPYVLQTEGWKERIGTLEEIVSGRLVDLGYYPTRPRTARKRYRIAAGVFFLLCYLILDTDFDLLHLFFGRDPGIALYLNFIGAFGLTGLILLVASRFLPQRTWKGGSALAQVQGFRRFLESAGKSAGTGMQIAGSFETYLPYAISFGLSERLFAAFEGIRRAAPAWFQIAGDIMDSSTDDVAREIGCAAAGMAKIFGKDSGAIQEATDFLRS